jgi:CheY-like chemotaxis protein
VVIKQLGNARAAKPPGGRGSIETGRRRLGADGSAADGLPAANYVVLSVSDTGTGIAEDIRAQVFEPFFTTKEIGKGTGLGLATCYGIVKQAGGQITVESEPGTGTTFTIFLPAASEPAEDESDEPIAADLPRGAETVLLVEDEPVLRRLAAKVLQGLGYEVLVASRGDEALKSCTEYDGNIDLLLTDVVMPGLSGEDLARQVAAMRPRTRVLFMSGYADSPSVRDNASDRTIDLLQKPFTPASLAHRLRDVLER